MAARCDATSAVTPHLREPRHRDSPQTATVRTVFTRTQTRSRTVPSMDSRIRSAPIANGWASSGSAAEPADGSDVGATHQPVAKEHTWDESSC